MHEALSSPSCEDTPVQQAQENVQHDDHVRTYRARLSAFNTFLWENQDAIFRIVEGGTTIYTSYLKPCTIRLYPHSEEILERKKQEILSMFEKAGFGDGDVCFVTVERPPVPRMARPRTGVEPAKQETAGSTDPPTAHR